MAIRMRRGLESELDISQAVPGEWLVSTDTRYIRMCFAPGIVLRMATYEAFEEDMKQIQSIVSEARTIQEAINRINTEVSANAEAVAEYTRQAKQYRDEAEIFKNQASAIVGVDIATESVHGLMAGGDNSVEDGVLTLTKVTTDRTLLKSHAGGLKVNSIDGESQQKHYTGKNKYDEVSLNKAFSYSGITATKNASGQLSFSGTSTASINEILGTFTLPAGTYYMSSGTHGGVSARLYNRTSSAFLLTNNGSFTLETESSLDIRIQISNGVTVSGTLQTQIEAGSTMTEYEPFVGNQPSPNPDYPQSIDSVVVSEIKTVGKNLQYNSATYEGWKGYNTELNTVLTNEYYNGGRIAKYTHQWRFIIPPSRLFKAGTYTISFDAKVSADGFVHVYSSFNVSKGIRMGASTSFKRYSLTFTLDKDRNGWIVPMIPDSSTVGELYIANIQVEEGSATEYEPYHESIIQLSNPITLRGIGDAKDVLCKQDGVYGVKRKFAKKVINGTESYDLFSAGNNSAKKYFGCWSLGEKAYYPMDKHCFLGYCTHLVPIDYFTMYWYAPVNRIALMSNAFFISLDGVTTVDALKTWLSTHNIEFMYELETPVFEPLPIADQIALHELETFDAVTHIFTDSEIEPIMEVEYGTSKVGAYALEAMLGKEANKLRYEQLNTLVSALSTQLVAGSEV